MRWSIEHGMSVRRTGSGPVGEGGVVGEGFSSRRSRGPELVWIHGLGESSTSFDPVIAHPAFAAHAHVLIDLPGYGRSAWPAEACGLEARADGIARWLADHAEPAPVLIGHSMGGVLATLVAERAPVRAIVNIDGNLSRGDCNFSGQVVPFTLAEFVARGFAEIRARVFADGATRPALRGYHAAMCFASPEAFHRDALELVALSESGQLAPRLAALRVPALFVAGVPDGICAASRALLDQHRVRWLAVAPAGHWVYLDQLDRFAAEVSRFVSG